MHWSILYQIYHQALAVVFYTRYTIRDRLYCSSSIVLPQFNESLLTTSIYLPTMGLQSCHSSPLQVQFTSSQSALHNMQFQFFSPEAVVKILKICISLYLCISVSLYLCPHNDLHFTHCMSGKVGTSSQCSLVTIWQAILLLLSLIIVSLLSSHLE